MGRSAADVVVGTSYEDEGVVSGVRFQQRTGQGAGSVCVSGHGEHIVESLGVVENCQSKRKHNFLSVNPHLYSKAQLFCTPTCINPSALHNIHPKQ